MKTPSVLLVAAVLSQPAAAQGPDGVATVTGRVITRADLAAGAPALSPEARLLEHIWPRIASDYVGAHGLAATPGEIEEALAYQREFERRDRAQRARKLEELAGRLAEAELAPEERARLENFRATLQRLARRDEEQAAAPPTAEQLRALAALRVEAWKTDRSLYARYGGVVGLTSAGPAPFGARAALLADYERLGLLEFADAALRARLYSMLREPPVPVVPPERVDFTPYWTRPIPPSYYPD